MKKLTLIIHYFIGQESTVFRIIIDAVKFIIEILFLTHLFLFPRDEKDSQKLLLALLILFAILIIKSLNLNLNFKLFLN